MSRSKSTQRSNQKQSQRWVRRGHKGVGQRSNRQLEPVYVPVKR